MFWMILHVKKPVKVRKNVRPGKPAVGAGNRAVLPVDVNAGIAVANKKGGPRRVRLFQTVATSRSTAGIGCIVLRQIDFVDDRTAFGVDTNEYQRAFGRNRE